MTDYDSFIDKDKFKTWLESKEPKTVVGKSVSAFNCPLANYLTNQSKLLVTVTSTCVTFFYDVDDYVDITVPQWFTNLVRLFDKKHREITASDALTALNSV